MFGISAGEFVVLLAVAAVVLGPERLPDYARQLARLIRELRKMAQGASSKVREEMGPEFDEIDWRKLDPRQYDPRRIVREALSEAFDPDDPLGLNEVTKPVSRGGPADTAAAGQRAAADGAAQSQQAAAASAAAGASANGTASASPADAPEATPTPAPPEPGAPSTPAYDPDAT